MEEPPDLDGSNPEPLFPLSSFLHFISFFMRAWMELLGMDTMGGCLLWLPPLPPPDDDW